MDRPLGPSRSFDPVPQFEHRVDGAQQPYLVGQAGGVGIHVVEAVQEGLRLPVTGDEEAIDVGTT